MRPQSNRGLWVVVFLVVTALLPGLSSGAPTATEQIKATVDKAIVVLKDSRYKPKTDERREQLKQILYARFDFAEMAKRSLGAHWRKRSAKEQEEFTGLFTDLLERTYAGIIESYSEEKVNYLTERVEDGTADVASKLITAKGVEYSINYRAHVVGGEWKVYDVIAENISLVNNLRSQFDRVITKTSYEELVRRMKAKADFGGAPKK
jgi:phospholipid transport system substrate-binding protein